MTAYSSCTYRLVRGRCVNVSSRAARALGWLGARVGGSGGTPRGSRVTLVLADRWQAGRPGRARVKARLGARVQGGAAYLARDGPTESIEDSRALVLGLQQRDLTVNGHVVLVQVLV